MASTLTRMLRGAAPAVRAASSRAAAPAAARCLATSVPAKQEKKLFTPGPLGVSLTTKQAMLRDLGSRDVEFIATVKHIRRELVRLAQVHDDSYTAVIVQGAGTMAVESVVSTAGPKPSEGRLLAIHNGAYGTRIIKIAEYLGINVLPLEFPETSAIDMAKIAEVLRSNSDIAMVTAVHCETSSGQVNDVEQIGRLVREHRPEATYFVDAMSSFGALPLNLQKNNIHYMVSSANKCIQGVPGFGYVIADRKKLQSCEGKARSFSLDLVEQVKGLDQSGQFRFTPATHAMLAFRQALDELEAEGGPAARAARYSKNREVLKAGMKKMGFEEFLPEELSSCIITTYKFPDDPNFKFSEFYERLNQKDLVIYPGKVTRGDCFRIGTIGELYPEDVEELLAAIKAVSKDMGVKLKEA